MLTLAKSVVALFACAIVQHQGPESEPPKKPLYALVVNEKNTNNETGDAARASIRILFLKDLTKWADGTEARPYAREASSDEQKAFVKLVLDMGDAELARHWLRLKNTNGTTPPKEVDSDRMVLKHVAKNEGAFAVVKLDAARAAKGVRVLFEF